MISQRWKDFYFSAMRPFAWLNAWRWQLQSHLRPPPQPIFLNLGCGDHYAPGFVNIEGNFFRKKDLWLDLRRPLPFSDESVERIYCCHVMEHFYLDDLRRLLKECHRVLKKGGGIRILVPSLDQAIAAYTAGQTEWFGSFPESYRSLGGKFFNFIFCASQHRLAFDFSFMKELLEDAGFVGITHGKPGDSTLLTREQLHAVEPIHEPHVGSSLVVEAQR